MLFSRKHRLDDEIKAFECCNDPFCPSSHSSEVSLYRICTRNWRKATTNPQSRGFKNCLRADRFSSWCGFQNSIAYALCGWSDVAMLSCHLCMDGWLLQKHSAALDQVAPSPSVWSTEINFYIRELIVVAIDRLLAMLPKVDTHDSRRWEGESGSKIISGRLSVCNLRRRLLEYILHLPHDAYCTWHCSHWISGSANAFDRLVRVCSWASLQVWQVQRALRDEVSIS